MTMSRSILCFYNEKQSNTEAGRQDCYFFRDRLLVVAVLLHFAVGGALFYFITVARSLHWNLWYASIFLLTPLAILMVTSAYEYWKRKSTNPVAAGLTFIGAAATAAGLCMVVYVWENGDSSTSALHDAGTYTMGSGFLFFLLALVFNERLYHTPIMTTESSDSAERQSMVSRFSATKITLTGAEADS
jgi:hypothetical protein